MEDHYQIEIQVTQDHINRGDRGNCASCPTALAVQEALDSPFVIVDHDHIGVWSNDEARDVAGHFCDIWKTPVEVQEFMNRFDNQKGAEPFTFNLRSSEELNDLPEELIFRQVKFVAGIPADFPIAMAAYKEKRRRQNVQRT